MDTAYSIEALSDPAADKACYDSKSYELAIQGIAVPAAYGDPVTKACIIKGIRHHPGFGKQLRDIAPSFARALNARAIMSGEIPVMNSLEHIPYCIWFPTIASEETYRALSKVHSSMRYQIGRACAAAGYVKLYQELNLLPDIHIAEEARDSGCNEIFAMIMSNSKLFSIMDDGRRIVQDDKGDLRPTILSAETQVCSWLRGLRRRPQRPVCSSELSRAAPPVQPEWLLLQNCHYNITEDFCVDIFAKSETQNEIISGDMMKAQRLATRFLYTPLPLELPTFDKDLLILVAAYSGDIDRYSRLKRSYLMVKELSCVIRGIYHNAFFARWWSLLLEADETQNLAGRNAIQSAINARAIMDNDLSAIKAGTALCHIPYNIWWPKMPDPSTLLKLLRVRPDMEVQIARALIIANAPEHWDYIKPKYDRYLMREAKVSHNRHFLEDLQKRFPDHEQLDRTQSASSMAYGWKSYTCADLHKAKLDSQDLVRDLTTDQVGTESEWVYDGFGVAMSQIELRVSSMVINQDIDGTSVLRTKFGTDVDAELQREKWVDVAYLYNDDEDVNKDINEDE